MTDSVKAMGHNWVSNLSFVGFLLFFFLHLCMHAFMLIEVSKQLSGIGSFLLCVRSGILFRLTGGKRPHLTNHLAGPHEAFSQGCCREH